MSCYTEEEIAHLQAADRAARKRMANSPHFAASLKTVEFKVENRTELDALGTALTQYIENTEEVEDELSPSETRELQAVRAMLERVELEQVKGI